MDAFEFCGYIELQVSGVGIQNPYRIRPFLGAKVPVNSSFSPVISMYNPHGTVLQVNYLTVMHELSSCLVSIGMSR